MCAAVWLGCAGLLPARDLAAAALAARGGASDGLARDADLTVHQGFPGVWQWQLAWGAQGRLRLVLRTDAEPQTLALDGERVATWLGNAQVSVLPAADSPVAALLRMAALSALDPLADPQLTAWQELPSAALLSGETRALRAHFRTAPEHAFVLAFDASLRLVRIAGSASIPGLGEGPIEARFRDYRRAEGLWLPFAIDYRFRGAPLLEERVLRWRADAWGEPGALARAPAPPARAGWRRPARHR